MRTDLSNYAASKVRRPRTRTDHTLTTRTGGQATGRQALLSPADKRTAALYAIG